MDFNGHPETLLHPCHHCIRLQTELVTLRKEISALKTDNETQKQTNKALSHHMTSLLEENERLKEEIYSVKPKTRRESAKKCQVWFYIEKIDKYFTLKWAYFNRFVIFSIKG